MELNWLQKIASVNLMYHGTSSTLSSSILSEGLNSDHERVWDEEKAEGDTHSRESYGGIYLTNNFMTAWAAARTATEKFGGQRLMVIAQLELRTPSIVVDEDQVFDPRLAIDTAMGVAANEWWYCYWASEGFPGMEKVVETYIELWKYRLENHESATQSLDHPARIENLTGPIIAMTQASVMREIAIAMEREKAQETYFGQLRMKYPAFADLSSSAAESNYRDAANEFMQKSNYLANAVKGRWHNVRTLEPISYSGRNKVVAVAVFNESTHEDRKSGNDAYYVDVDVIYSRDNRAIQMLVEDIRQALSQDFRVRSRDQVFYEQKKTQP